MSISSDLESDESTDEVSANDRPTESLYQSLVKFKGKEKRRHPRIPRSVGIIVQPLDIHMAATDQPFLAITRDVSEGGLSYVSDTPATFDMAVITLNDDRSREIICRICGTGLIFANEFDEVFLTNVEFLHESPL